MFSFTETGIEEIKVHEHRNDVIKANVVHVERAENFNVTHFAYHNSQVWSGFSLGQRINKKYMNSCANLSIIDLNTNNTAYKCIKVNIISNVKGTTSLSLYNC